MLHEKKNEGKLTCISCPIGCTVSYRIEDDGSISCPGNRCPRGKAYTESEMIDPRRIVTSTVDVTGSNLRLPVKTAAPIPKDKIFLCMEDLRHLQVELPVHCGDILIMNTAETGIPIVAAKSLQ